MKRCNFPNDNNVEIILPSDGPEDNILSTCFEEKNNNELMFRLISTFLINNKIFKGNIIDLGAWIGDNTIPWAKNIQGIVYAIDPSQSNCSFIQKVSELNCLNNVVVISSAISDKFEILSTNDTMNHCTFGKEGKNKVLAMSLDFLYEECVITNIGYIHLDVEGMEFNVIRGADKLIKTCRPIIAFEQHLATDNFQDLCQYLKKYDYCVTMINEELPICRPDCRNFLAFPEEKVSHVFFDSLYKYLDGYYVKYDDFYLKFF